MRQLIIDGIRTVCPPLAALVQPPVIDRTGMILRNRPQILDLVRRRLPALEPWFDVNAMEREIVGFPRSRAITALDLVKLVNALILLDIPRGGSPGP